MYICPKKDDCHKVLYHGGCRHAVPHEKQSFCTDPYCGYHDMCDGKEVPYTGGCQNVNTLS